MNDDISWFLQNRKQIETRYKEKGYVAIRDKNILGYSQDFHTLESKYPNAVIREIHSDFGKNTEITAEFVNGHMQRFTLERQKEDKTYKVESDGNIN